MDEMNGFERAMDYIHRAITELIDLEKDGACKDLNMPNELRGMIHDFDFAIDTLDSMNAAYVGFLDESEE